MIDPEYSEVPVNVSEAGNEIPAEASIIPEPRMVDIAHRTHALYIRNGRQQGQFREYWFQAETELRDERRQEFLRKQGEWW